MAKHVLSLEVPDTLNECVMLIMDTSIYDSKVPVECPYLDILPPGYTCAIRLDITPDFCKVNLTACDLALQTEDCGTIFNVLPDGVYVIRYSIAPNEYVYVEYNHLRITIAMNKLQKALCALDVANCDPLPEVKKKLEELRLIEMMLKAAKAKVEFCHNPSQGMDLYEYALKRLDKISCTLCI